MSNYWAIFLQDGKYMYTNHATYQECLNKLTDVEEAFSVEPIGIYRCGGNRFEWHLRSVQPLEPAYGPIYQATLFQAVLVVCEALYKECLREG